MSASPAPFFREAGSGPGVVCLHSNAASSSQWRSLMERLAPRFHVLAPDGHGAGKGPRWPAGRGVSLADEAALFEPVFERAGAPFVLVGHSHGAAVALVAAAQRPERVRALVLYEPPFIALVDADRPPPNDADGLRAAVDRAEAALHVGDGDAAARHFIDFWMGEGAWAQTPEARRVAIVDAVANVRGWADALTHEPTPLAAFASLDVPVLLMTGSASPAPGHAPTRVLASVLRHAEQIAFDGLGHMGPLTHPQQVDPVIEDFLARLPA